MNREPIEHWVSNWEGKHSTNPKDRKKVTSCTACSTGTAYFKGGMETYLCYDCFVRWFPNKTQDEMAELLDRQAGELERVIAHERYKRKRKCARCGNVAENRDSKFCGECFDIAVRLKVETL